jgi:hypothetical protein
LYNLSFFDLQILIALCCPFGIFKHFTHIDHTLPWLDTPNTQIHDHTLPWLDTPNTHIHDHTLPWLGTCTSMKSGGVKLVLWVSFLSEIMQSRKRFLHVSKMFEDTKGATKGNQNL